VNFDNPIRRLFMSHRGELETERDKISFISEKVARQVQ